MRKALEGIKILDLGHVLAAPFCTMILADLGAEVIKVEPPIGDDSRQFGPFIQESGSEEFQSGYFISINRNKKSLCLNLKTDEGKEILRDMIRQTDVLIENFRPTTMTRLGFSYEELKEINPEIIYCSICGFGHDALPEYATKPAYDMVAQAYSGLMSVTGPEGGEPCRVGTSVGDIIAGHQAAIAILSALWYRRLSGEGQYIDISMVDGLIYTLENAVARYTIHEEIPQALGAAHPTITPFQAFRTKNNWIIVPIGNDKLWADFCRAIGHEELLDDERFKTNPLRTANKKDLNGILYPVFESKDTGEWIEILSAHKLPFSPLHTIADVVHDKQVNYRDMIVEIDQTNVGKMKVTGTPFHMSATPGSVDSPAPLLGEHTSEILEEYLGLTTGKIEELKKRGVIV